MKKRFILTFILSLVAFTILYSTLWYKVLNKETVAAPGDVSELEDDELDDKYDLPVDNELVFVMMGVDAKDVKESKGTRTDTLMLFKVNFESGKIDILSIPRDTRVLIRGREDKINHAHAFGGPSLTIRTIEDFLGIDLNYYVKVDYKAVRSIVDAIGGVEIDVPQRMRYSDPTADPPLNINLQAGLQILDGDQAHDFLRFRSYRDGDLGRISAQQYFLKELIKQTLQLKNIVKLPGLVETYFDYVETNIPMKMVLKGIKAAKNMDAENMTTTTIPGTSQKINGVDYLIYDREVKESIVQEMFADYLLKQ